LGRIDSAQVLKLGVASIFGALIVAVVVGDVAFVVGTFVALVFSLRLQRRQEVRRLHGYRRRRRRTRGSRKKQ
jgi:hypothetical protein